MKQQRNKYNVNNRNNYYNYTSTAYDYEKEYKSSPSINKRIKKVKKEKYVKAEQGIKFLSLKSITTFTIIVTFIIAIIFIEALIIQRKFDIDTLNAELKEITENNKNLETELAKNLDLEYVEHVATTELGMQKPAYYQIVHINVPKESYSEKGNIKKQETFLTKLYNFIKTIF